MRGIFFQQPLEFRLEVEGDEWVQGDSVSCVLSIKNRGSETRTLDGLYLHLATGTLKKVKQKQDDAFLIVSSAECRSPAELAPDEQQSFPWTFKLDQDCPITDKSQSLYLICGQGEISDAAGHLLVNVKPHEHIQEFLNVFEDIFSFVLKGQKSKKDWVESKLKPPAGKQYPTLEHLMLSARFKSEVLDLKYCFHMKKIHASAESLKLNKAKTNIEQQLQAGDYMSPAGYIDHAPLEKAIGEILEKVESKL